MSRTCTLCSTEMPSAALSQSFAGLLCGFTKQSFSSELCSNELFPHWLLCNKKRCLEFGSKFPNVEQTVSYFLKWASFHFQLMIYSYRMLMWPFCLTGPQCA